MSTGTTLAPAPSAAAGASRAPRGGVFDIPLPKVRAGDLASVETNRDGPTFRDLLLSSTGPKRGARQERAGSSADRESSRHDDDRTAADEAQTRRADRATPSDRPERGDRPSRTERSVSRAGRDERTRRDDDTVRVDSDGATSAPAEDVAPADSAETAPAPVEDDAERAAADEAVSTSTEDGEPVRVDANAVATDANGPSADTESAKLLRQLAWQGEIAQAQTTAAATGDVAAQATAASGAPAAEVKPAAPTPQQRSSSAPSTPTASLESPESADRAKDPAGDLATPNLPPRGGTAKAGVRAATPAVQRQASVTSDATANAVTAVTPESAKADAELARLVALAAGLSDGGTPTDDGAQAARALTSPGRAEPGKADASTGDGASTPEPSARLDAMLAARGRGESFGQVLGNQRTASAGSGQAAQNVERVVDVVRANVGAKNSSITLKLDPPELGAIRIDATLRDQVLSLRVQAETAEARELLHSRMNDLKQALDRHGISVDRFDIEPRPAHSNNAHDAGDRHAGDRPSGSPDNLLQDGWAQRNAPDESSGDGAARWFEDREDASAAIGVPAEDAVETGEPIGRVTESSVNVVV